MCKDVHTFTTHMAKLWKQLKICKETMVKWGGEKKMSCKHKIHTGFQSLSMQRNV